MDDKKIIEVCNTSLTMRSASEELNMSFSTFKRRAIKLGVYKPNQPGRGTSKPVYSLKDVFAGKVQMKSNQLRKRLIKEGYKECKCEGDDCVVAGEWNNKPIVLELDHINGIKTDNRLDNLRILCPNCHSQTPTFRRKKKK